MSGFGPSCRRVVERCESEESRLTTKTKSRPPALGGLVFVAVIIFVLSGITCVYDGEAALGAALLGAAAAVAVFYVARAARASS